MIRNFKALGLALVAVLAMSAVAASGAQASVFHADEAPVLFEGEQVVQHVFKIKDAEGNNTITVTCKTATFKGTNAAKTSSTAELEAAYGTCKLAGTAADVNMNKCKYLFHTSESALTATVDVVGCEAGKPIEVVSTTTNCIVKVGNQTGLQHVTFANSGAGATRDTLATISVGGAGKTGITYDQVGSECPKPGNAQTGGEYTGTATIKGYKDVGGVKGVQQGVWVE